MTPVVRVRPAVRSRHLEAMLSAYADRSLSPAVLLACDQHVAICPGCRAAVDAERRLLSSLRTAATPGLPSRLEWALLDLAVHAVPPIPAGGPPVLPVVNRSAPAMYRSPVRAALLASLAAGASAAAAWSLGVSGPGAAGASLTVVRLPSPGATAGSMIGSASSSQVASFLNVSRLAGVEAPAGLTTMFTAVSTRPVPVATDRPVLGPPRLPARSLRSAQSIHE